MTPRERLKGQFGLVGKACSDPTQLLTVFGPESCDVEGIVSRVGPYVRLGMANVSANKSQPPSTVDWLSYLFAVCEHAEFIISRIQVSQRHEQEFGSRLGRLTRDEERTWTDSRHVLGDVLNIRESAVRTDRTFHECPLPEETRGLSVAEIRRALSRISEWVVCRLNANRETVSSSRLVEKRVSEPDPTLPVPETRTPKEKTLEWLTQAMLLVQEYPGWSDAAIARKVGKDPSTLSRNPTYRMAASMARSETRKNVKPGFVTEDDSRQLDIEAIDDSCSPARDNDCF